MATTIGLSLNDLQSQLMEAIFAGAAIVHYVHALQAFTYFLPGDRSMYAKEMKLLRKQLLNGIIVDVRAGDDFHINGKTLFPLDVKFDGRECHAYMLLLQQQLFQEYPGAVKSLGAWGGDFILVTGNEDTPKFFEEKGFETVIAYKDMIL